MGVVYADTWGPKAVSRSQSIPGTQRGAPNHSPSQSAPIAPLGEDDPHRHRPGTSPPKMTPKTPAAGVSTQPKQCRAEPPQHRPEAVGVVYADTWGPKAVSQSQSTPGTQRGAPNHSRSQSAPIAPLGEDDPHRRRPPASPTKMTPKTPAGASIDSAARRRRRPTAPPRLELRVPPSQRPNENRDGRRRNRQDNEQLEQRQTKHSAVLTVPSVQSNAGRRPHPQPRV